MDPISSGYQALSRAYGNGVNAMAVRSFNAYTSTDTPLVTTAETVVATLGGISTNQPGQTLNFHGSFTGTSGTTTSAYTLRVREDSVSGAIVGESVVDAIEAAVGAVETHTIDCSVATPNEFSGKTYVLTVQQTAATANGNVTQASLTATITP